MPTKAQNSPMPWLMGPKRDRLLPPEHLYTNPKGISARGTLVPKLNGDIMHEIMHQFYDLCEPGESTVPRKKVETKIMEIFAWSGVMAVHWKAFFEQFRREKSGQYNFAEFFALFNAVNSGEFFSSDGPDAYREPEKWVRKEDGRLTPRKPDYEPMLISPREFYPPSAFKECLGQLFHYFGLDDPRLLFYRLSKSGRQIDISSFEFFHSEMPPLERGLRSSKGNQSVVSMQSRSQKSISGSERGMYTPSPTFGRRALSRSTGPLTTSSDLVRGSGSCVSPDMMPWQSPAITWQAREVQRLDTPFKTSSQNSIDNILESWDLQSRCHGTLEARGELDQELLKIFRYYFPDASTNGNPAQEQHRNNLLSNETNTLDRSTSSSSKHRRILFFKSRQPIKCTLEVFWEFWTKIGFFRGPFKDSPAFFINKSFAVGANFNVMYDAFANEASEGRRYHIHEECLSLNFQGWIKALEEFSTFLFPECATERNLALRKIITQLILPSCDRPNPNPVFMHFRRAEVLAQLNRYSGPLRKLFKFFIGLAPTPDVIRNIMLKEKPVFSSQEGLSQSFLPSDEGPAKLEGSGDEAMTIEEFLIFAKCMDLCPGKIDELSLRYIFVRSNFGLDADSDINMLVFEEFTECLCRIALICFGKNVLERCDPGQTGDVACVFSGNQGVTPQQYPQSEIESLFEGMPARRAHSRGRGAKKEAQYGGLASFPAIRTPTTKPSVGRRRELAEWEKGSRQREDDWIADNSWVLNPSAVRSGKWAEEMVSR